MNEEMKMILKLTEENARMRCALNLLKQKFSENLNQDDLSMILDIAGMNNREVNVICFDNAPNEVAYES